METAQELLLQEAKKQWILRISATWMNGVYDLGNPGDALRILQKYDNDVTGAAFPVDKYWMLDGVIGNFSELITLARSLSSSKTPEQLWLEVENEWGEFLEIREKMSVSTNAIQRAQLVPYYLDELADVYWNLAKFDAFSNQERTPAQRMFISEIEQQKTFGENIFTLAWKKFKTRYLWIAWIESPGLRDERWGKIKREQQIVLLRESKQRWVRILLWWLLGERRIYFGSESDLQVSDFRKVLVNKWLKNIVFSSLAALSWYSEEDVMKIFDRKDYAVVRVKNNVVLIQFVKWPEGTMANMKMWNALESIFVGGTDTIRKLRETDLPTSDEEVLSGVLFWGRGEILCISDKSSVDRMISGELPTRIITRGTPYLTENALKKSDIGDVEILSTDSNVEGMISISAQFDPNKIVLGTEVVETGRSVEMNGNYILYWDKPQRRVLVYSPCSREKNGLFPAKNLYGTIDQTNNPSVYDFVRQFQTPLDVSIACLWDKKPPISALPVVKRVMEIMATSSSKYQ